MLLCFAEQHRGGDIGQVAILIPDGTPLIVGDRRYGGEKPWVDLETGMSWRSAAGAIAAAGLARVKNMS